MATARRVFICLNSSETSFTEEKRPNPIGEKVDRDFAAASHDEAMQNGIVFVDSRKRGAERIQRRDSFRRDNLCRTRRGVGRQSSSAGKREATIFKSLGMVVEDVAAATLVYHNSLGVRAVN